MNYRPLVVIRQIFRDLPRLTRNSFVRRAFCVLLVLAVTSLLCGQETKSKRSPARKIELRLTATYPHNRDSFCQGLEYQYDEKLGKETLLESTGHYGRSKILLVDLKTGQTIRESALDKSLFAEGIATVGEDLYQLTWQEHVCLVYDKNTFQLKADYRYKTEGWGLAWTGSELVLSDGSSQLHFIDPKNFTEKRKESVWYRDNKRKKKSLGNLNELEYIEGEIWANVYQTPYIVRINPDSGEVLQFFNLSNLFPKGIYPNEHDLVLNGIAYDDKNKRIFLTGKCWPVLYEIAIEYAD